MINTGEIELSRRALVVLLHGFMGGRIQFVPMASMLSRSYDVLNYGYPSRADTIEGHAGALLEVIESKLRHDSISDIRQARAVHFVTHSFGGVVLHRAFADGLSQLLTVPSATRCVMLAPPVRGASLARAFRKEELVGPEFVRQGVHAMARTVLGPECGAQLMTREPELFSQSIGTIPKHVQVLVITANAGRINPLINQESDGVVGVSETILNRPHFRKSITLTHNLMLYSRQVWTSVSSFLEGNEVGEWHE